MRLIADRRERLDRFLARHLPQFTRSRLAGFIEEGGVSVPGKAAKAGLVLRIGMEVEVDEIVERPAHDLSPAEIPLDVPYEDADLLVVNKPRGLAAHPSPTLKGPSLVNALLARGQGLSPGAATFRPGIVHRLDKETTGLMVVAKTEFAHGHLAKQFAAKQAQRIYVAVLSGDLGQERLKVEAPLARDRSNRLLMAVDPNGKAAVTHFRRLARLDSGTYVAVRLETGRTHQIRAHAKAIGHPVVGDPLYGSERNPANALQLHAAFLAFIHPRTGEPVSLAVPPPSDFHGEGQFRAADLAGF